VTQVNPPIQAGGGLAVTVSQSPTLLTEYAPVTIINTSTTSRIWLASNSSVSASNGVPLEAGTSYTWQTPGVLYAIVDSSALDSTVPVVLTGAGGDWSPSPVAIGAAVATQLLASGVPQKLLITELGTFLNGTGLGQVGGDLTGYASLFLFATFAGGGVNPTLKYQFATDSGINIGQQDTLACNDAGYIPGIILPVTGKFLVCVASAGIASVRIVGYNRSLSRVPLGNGFQSSGAQAAMSGLADSSLHTIPIATGQMCQGYCYVVVQISMPGNSVTSALTFNIGYTINGVMTLVFLTDQQTTISFGTASYRGFVALPAAACHFVIQCTSVPLHPTNVNIQVVPAAI
jgi:hypothetical protein